MVGSCWLPRMILHALATETRVAELSDDRTFGVSHGWIGRMVMKFVC